MQFAFISRHSPTPERHAMAEDQGHTLTHIGDLDAFTVDARTVHRAASGLFDGVVVVHPAAALRLAPSFAVGVFENANRAPVGAPPQFVPVAFHVFDLRGD